jgi:hypothetical protein
VQVVEQCLEGAEIQNAQSPPILGEHSRKRREERGFSLSAGRRGEQQHMLPIQYWGDAALLQRTEFPPTQRIDDVMLDGWMEARK